MMEAPNMQIDWLHQISVSRGSRNPSRKLLWARGESALNIYPEAKYRVWIEADIRKLMLEEFDSEVIWAYDTLVPPEFKVQLSSYCILYVFGGIYLDIAIEPVGRLDPPGDCGITAFRPTSEDRTSWIDLHTSFLWSRPRRDEWMAAISRVIQHCRLRDMGGHPQYPAGGIPLGWAFANTLVGNPSIAAREEQWVGEIRRVPQRAGACDLSYVAPDGKLVGLRFKEEEIGDGECIISNPARYREIFEAADVYRST